MYVQLTSVQQVEINGKMTRCNPGDWVDVGRQTAMLWLSNGQANLPHIPDSLSPDRASIISVQDGHVLGKAFQDWKPITSDFPAATDQLNCIVTGIGIRAEIAMVGLTLLQETEWQVIVPLRHDVLAYKLLTPVPAEVQEKLFDLRVPTYDTRLIFAKRCPEVKTLLDAYRDYVATYPAGIAFLMALWDVKPLILPVPADWIGENDR